MQEMLFTVKQVSQLLHSNTNYVYQLINNNLLPALKLGSYKVRKSALEKFLEDYEGYDLTDPNNVKQCNYKTEDDSKVKTVNFR